MKLSSSPRGGPALWGSTPELPSSPLVDPAGATEEAHVGKSSVFASSINLSNTILGAGTLAMPYACRQCGIALFGILLLVMALGSHFAIRMLTSCVVKNNLVAAKYPSLGALAYGRKGEIAAGLAVVLQQLGPCITYIQITSDALEPILCKAWRQRRSDVQQDLLAADCGSDDCIPNVDDRTNGHSKAHLRHGNDFYPELLLCRVGSRNMGAE